MRRIVKTLFAFMLATALGVGLLCSSAMALAPDQLPADEFDGYLVRLVEPELVQGRGVSAQMTPEVTLAPIVGVDGLYFADSIEDTNRYVHAGMVVHIIPNYRIYLLDVPNDTYYSGQWGMPVIGADTLRERDPDLTGAGVRVGIMDSGIDPTHPDLLRADGTSCVVSGGNFSGPDGVTENPEAYQDDYYHGTRVAGILAATANNGEGIAGVAPEVDLVALKIFRVVKNEQTGAVSTAGNTANALPALYAAVDDFDCDVINMSFGIRYTNDTIHSEFDRAIEYAVSKGVLLVASAGNGGDTYTNGVYQGNRPYFPAAHPSVVSVAWSDKDGKVASGSQRHPSANISAPGQGIYGTNLDINTGAHGYASGSGTSFAAPQVAAAGALLKQRYPDLTQAQFMAMLEQSAQPLTAGGAYNAFGGAGILYLPALIPQEFDIGGQGTARLIHALGLMPGGTVRVIVAGYDENHRMVETRMQEITTVAGRLLTLHVNMEQETVRAFVLDEHWVPLGYAE